MLVSPVIDAPMDNQILDNLATALLVVDKQQRVSYINQVAEVLLAVSARHVIGHPPDEAIACKGEPLLDMVRVVAEGQAITKRGVNLDHVGVTVDCTMTPVIEDDGTWVIIELQQVDRAIRISRENQLISQQAMTRDVVRGLAHEIKNPLGGLRGAAQLLESELDSDELKEYTQIIIEEADRLQELVNRMIGPNRRPDYREVNIHTVLERVRALVAAEVKDRITIQRDYDPSIPDLIGDEAQLVQAVLNIMTNAAKVLTDGGHIVIRTRILRRFTIGETSHKLVAQIEIVDDGPGIPPEIAETLFFPMVTKNTGGTGLGLSIAQGLISQHGGLIECQSVPGNTVFRVLLPVSV